MKRITCCVTNDLATDQRMMRICTSLAEEGWQVTLLGRSMPGSRPLPARTYRQARLSMFFSKGKLFYLEYNLRLLVWLLFHRTDLIVSVDLDTIIPCYYASRLKGVPRVHDAHELFTELREVVARPAIQRAWLWVERRFLPRFPAGYTVSGSIAEEFERRYGLKYGVMRNTPQLKKGRDFRERDRILLYQGAVNEGRCFEWLIPAMKWVNAPLHIYGEGNFSRQCMELVSSHGLEDKVLMKGSVPPEELEELTGRYYAGVNLVEPVGLNQVYSLANKFFDYIHAGIPQLTMDFPEYRKVNDEYGVALLIPRPDPEIIAAELNKLLENEVLCRDLTNNCIRAAGILNWQQEEKKLKALYHKILD